VSARVSARGDIPRHDNTQQPDAKRAWGTVPAAITGRAADELTGRCEFRQKPSGRRGGLTGL